MELACTRNKLKLCSYTREMARCPDYRSPLEEKSLKITHAYYSIEQKPHEMRIGKVRNAIRCPRTVVVHLWNAPANRQSGTAFEPQNLTSDRSCNGALAVA